MDLSQWSDTIQGKQASKNNEITARLQLNSLSLYFSHSLPSPLPQIGVCEVKNGFPKPNITWYRNDTPLRTHGDGEINSH